jgi:hypothetical protein
LELEVAVQAGPVSGFGKKLSSILEKYFSELVPFLLMSFNLQIFKYADLPEKYFDLLCIISWNFCSLLLNVWNKVSTLDLSCILFVHTGCASLRFLMKLIYL